MSIHIKRILPDGSTRQFFKIYTDSLSLILMYNPVHTDKINENDSYYYIGTHLYNKGISVPRISFYDRCQGILWIEDLGNIHLQEIVDFDKEPNKSFRWYERILEIMGKLCRDGAQGFDPGYCYDTPVYDSAFIIQRELGYFLKEFLMSYMKIRPHREIEKEFILLSEAVSEIPNNFLIHRDFQSRNIMIHNNKPYLIDFQGARFGPPTYDLASLIIDPYVGIPVDYQFYLIKEYFLNIKKLLPYCWEEFLELFWKTALCRNMQILGAFSFLSIKKKKPSFRRFIPPALAQLNMILEYLKDAFPLIKSLISG